MLLGPNVTSESSVPDATDTTGNTVTMSPIISLEVSTKSGCRMVTILVRQAVHNRETDHDLGFVDGMLHMERACEFDCLDRGHIKNGVARTFLNGYFGQVSVGSNDGFQNNFALLAVQASRTRIALQFGHPPPE